MKSIGASAFVNCSKLKSITIPSSVTSIGDGAFDSLYYDATWNLCSNGNIPITIYGNSGSAAQKYAKSYGIRFNTYMVTFNTVGGSRVSSKSVKKNGTISAPKSSTKKGYKFAGWYKDSKYKKAWNFKTSRVTGNITLYAKWKK